MDAPRAKAAPGGLHSSLELLRERPYRWVLTGFTAMFMGVSGQIIPRAVLAHELTGDAQGLGLVSVAVAVPMLLFAPLGGALADRIERRRLIIAMQALLFVSELLVFTLAVSGALQFWQLLAGAAVMGTVFPFSMPARQALTVDVVGHHRILQSMALGMGMMNATRVAAPMLAGALVPLVGARGALAYGVCFYGLALLCMFPSPASTPARGGEPKRIFSDVVRGLRYAFREQRSVAVLLLYGILPMLVLMPTQVFLLIFARDVWGGAPLPFGVGAASPDLAFGILQAAAGLGGVASALWLAVLGDIPQRSRLLLLSLLGFAAALTGFCWTPWFWAALPLLFAAGVLSNAFSTLSNSSLQSIISDQVRGRISSLMLMVTGLAPLGALPMGAAVDAFGAPAAVTGATVLMTAAGLLFVLCSRSLRRLDQTLHEKQHEVASS